MCNVLDRQYLSFNRVFKGKGGWGQGHLDTGNKQIRQTHLRQN